MDTSFIEVLKTLDSLYEDLQPGYQEGYKEYIRDHRARVKEVADWLKENLPELFDNVDMEEFNERIEDHDLSKFSEEEFEPYAQKWFNNGVESPEYEEAWRHHWMHNGHHPEFWMGEDIPYIYILEMLCDWGSFSIDERDFGALSDFYYNKAKDDPEKNLSDNTKKTIEEILSKINSITSSEGGND